LTLRIGTRGSALALAQARLVAEQLDGEAELVPITTSGDRGRGGDKARFVKEIEESLLRSEIDLAVHSAKDVPSELPDGLSIVGVPRRADPSDVLCGTASLDDLPSGAAVGTGSLRRRAQLLALRPDLEVRELRGNVDTRLRKLGEGNYDALVLAGAGLERLGRSDEGSPLPELVPAPGQGCLAVEAREDDEHSGAAAAAITDPAALAELMAERAVVEALDATCRTPVGARAELGGHERLTLTAFVGLPDGSHWIRDELDGPAGAPADLGRDVAERLLAAGARGVLDAAERAAAPG
jgi:hydroxymethylbilane synthase